ncbi:PTS beta-glucoside transporter subunit EIIBCA [Enterococcus florum]|uniref:PTS beta-glucoside transporter subunit EIIBCA n=1 Tax=Enterococcus florum TaxID=2480627 RepID=A0A4P5PAH8_9ENTE|nr:beta-glucoside-specific PTS transporter subunit IIABC [Enterococcus florum]GCF94656.1 PTS beta-glucoside transporter subunit EIIBCA [Enterococcus florum]
MKYEAFCNQIIELVGGKRNVEAVVHCMTRLRFTLKDASLAKADEIRALDSVVDVVSNKISFQIIIGTEVAKIYPELLSLLGMENVEESKTNKNVVKRILDLLSESITPTSPALMSVGLIAGILSIFTLTGLLSPESSTYIIFDSIKTAMFSFLPVFMAVSASKRLGTNTYMGILLAATLLTPTINGVEGLTLFGISLPTITYSSSFLPILLGIWFMGKVTAATTKIVPKSLDYFISPVIIIMITLPVTLLLFGPIGTWISNGLSFVVDFLTQSVGSWVVVALYAAFQPFLIMLGAANFTIPLIMNAFASQGFETIFVPGFIISDLAVSGVMFGYFLRAKEKKQKSFFGTVAFSAFMGVTEPAIFGAFVKYRRPFMAVAIGGGIGGLIAGVMNVKAYSLTTLFGVASFIGDNQYSNFYFMIIALVVAFIGSVIAGYLLWLPKETAIDEVTEINETADKSVLSKVDIIAPVAGEKVPLNEINDPAFSSGALGKGIGITPTENSIKAPISGRVVSLFPTNHAIGIKNEDGVEVLIHIGVDTVELKGQFFKPLVKVNDPVELGTPLIEVDFDQVKEHGFDPTVIMVVTNTQDYLDVVANTAAEPSRKELLTVVL